MDQTVSGSEPFLRCRVIDKYGTCERDADIRKLTTITPGLSNALGMTACAGCTSADGSEIKETRPVTSAAHASEMTGQTTEDPSLGIVLYEAEYTSGTVDKVPLLVYHSIMFIL